MANNMRRKRPGRDQVVFVGVAQERAFAFKAQKTGAASFEYSRQSVFVKHYYFYLDDAYFGPAFIKIGTYAPFPVRICINRRVLEVERVSQDCVFSSDAVERLMQPTVTDDAQRASGLRFGDPRAMALMAASG